MTADRQRPIGGQEQEAERPAAPQRTQCHARPGSSVQGQPAALGRAT